MTYSTENFVKFGNVVSENASIETCKHTLIKVLRIAAGCDVKMVKRIKDVPHSR